MSLYKNPVHAFILGVCFGGLAVLLAMHNLCNVKNTLNETVYTCTK